ncbi:MAG: ceramidase domain-containing protein [Acidobacteria bacterium]|nr:ceramidase domain-containing protein [Acidobacteriota bacterium]
MSVRGTAGVRTGTQPPWRFLALFVSAVIAAVVTLRLAPPTQDPSYHLFADSRSLLGIPNFADTSSNLAFVAAGVHGLFLLFRTASRRFEHGRERWPYGLAFAGAILVGIGSSVYHLSPNDTTLFWDRLPMTLVFMAVFSSVIMERLDEGIGLASLPVLLPLGASSALYWHVTGVLRPYALVQFFPLLMIPVFLLLFPSRYTGGERLWLVLGLYAAAKAAEVWDQAIFDLLGAVSGHTVKHLLAALAIAALARMLLTRTIKEPPAEEGLFRPEFPRRLP